MFDIKEYYLNDNYKSPDCELERYSLEEDISIDIDDLLLNAVKSKYNRDLYKNGIRNIEIISPKIIYPGNKSYLTSSDKIRFLLSFYPYKRDLDNIEKIILRPRYIESGNVELVSLFLRQSRTVVLYLSHPHHYSLNSSDFGNSSEFVSLNLDKIMTDKLLNNKSVSNYSGQIKAHPLWYIISTLSSQNSEKVEKFFIKNSEKSSNVRRILTDISYYYSRKGY